MNPSNKRTIPWAGRDLTPLCFESLINCVLRLAWRNALCKSDLIRHFNKTRTNYLDLDLAAFGRQTSWKLDPDRIRNFEKETSVGDWWWSRRMRYCPICLEACYHADVFQCSMLIHCPLHRIELLSHCQSCGLPTDVYQLASGLFRRAYRCHECGKPIAGAEPSIDAYLDLRDDMASLRRALEPYELWLTATSKRRHELKALCADRGINLRGSWCGEGEFLRGLLLKDCAPPEYIRDSPFRKDDLVVLKWQTKIKSGPRSQTAQFGTRNWYQRVGTATAVYRSTLRSLTRWIAGRHECNEVDAFAKIHIDKEAKVSAYPIDAIALLLMRWQLETGLANIPNFGLSPIELAQLRNEPRFGMRSFDGRMPRLGWRAMFLAIYASWYWRLERGQSAAWGDFLHSSLDAPARIYARNSILGLSDGNWREAYFSSSWIEEARYEGEVCFPRIDGMPLRPWST